MFVVLCFCCCVVCIYQVLFFALFIVLACISIHVYHAYILDMDLRPSHIIHLIFKNTCGINFKISGGVRHLNGFSFGKARKTIQFSHDCLLDSGRYAELILLKASIFMLLVNLISTFWGRSLSMRKTFETRQQNYPDAFND